MRLTGVDVTDVSLLEPSVQLEHLVVGRALQALGLFGGGVEFFLADHLVTVVVTCLGWRVNCGFSS